MYVFWVNQLALNYPLVFIFLGKTPSPIPKFPQLPRLYV